MPRTINGRKVATEQELLDFANAIRKAGGANVIEALLPSEPGNPDACLIANALNFGCAVGGWSADRYGGSFPDFADGSSPWFMTFPDSMDADEIRDLAQKVPGTRFAWVWDVGSPVYDRFRGTYEYINARRMPALRLPRHIGNAAGAFDDGEAFQNFNMHHVQFEN